MAWRSIVWHGNSYAYGSFGIALRGMAWNSVELNCLALHLGALHCVAGRAIAQKSRLPRMETLNAVVHFVKATLKMRYKALASLR